MSAVEGNEASIHGDGYYYDAADGQLYPGISHIARRAQATDEAREAEARLNQTHYSQRDANAELAMVVGFCALTATPLAIALYSQNHQAFNPLIERVMGFFGG